MKTKKKPSNEPMVLQDKAAEPYKAEEAMVRTQVYLTRAEHDFLTHEAERRGEAMSVVLREIIDEKMTIPEDAWTNNPMLEPTPDVPGWQGPGDGSINHDHYIYGCPKKYEKRKGKWVLLPPIDE